MSKKKTSKKKQEHSKRDFNYFQKRLRKWRTYFGLYEWNITAKKEDIGPDRLAEVHRIADGRHACVALNTRLVKQPTKNDKDYGLCRAAFHELMHVILADMSQAATTGIGWERVEVLEETIIRRMESTVHSDLLYLWQLQRENEKLKSKLAACKGEKVG